MTHHDIPLDIKDQIVDHICSGHKVLAVKLMMRAVNCSLRDAKEAVDCAEDAVHAMTGE